jgi:hypothetical protein
LSGGASGIVAISNNLGGPHGFPGSQQCLDEEGMPVDCDVSEWFRALVFLEGLPYLLAMRPYSPDASVDLIISPLTSDLNLGNPQTLNFSPECDPTLPAEELATCEALKATMTHPVLAPIGIQSDTRTSTTSLALYRETQMADSPEVAIDIAFVVLGHDKLDRPAGNLVSEPMLPWPKSPEGRVAIDSRAMYVQFDAGPTSMIVQKTTLAEEFIVLTEFLAIEPAAELLQLDEDIALGRVADGQWQLVKLFPDAPEESRVTLFDPGSELVRFTAAGPGTFLLHERDAGPDLVRVRCTNEPPETP